MAGRSQKSRWTDTPVECRCAYMNKDRGESLISEKAPAPSEQMGILICQVKRMLRHHPPKGMCLQHDWDLTFRFPPLSADHRSSGSLMLLHRTKAGRRRKKNTAKEALTHLLLLDKSKFMALSAFESLLSP